MFSILLNTSHAIYTSSNVAVFSFFCHVSPGLVRCGIWGVCEVLTQGSSDWSLAVWSLHL